MPEPTLPETALPESAPIVIAGLLAGGLASATTCLVWPDSGCSGTHLVWPVWDTVVGGVASASGLPMRGWFQEGGALVPLIAAGPPLTSTIGLLALLTLAAWARARTRTRRQLALAIAAGAVAAALVPLGLWGSFLFVAVRL